MSFKAEYSYNPNLAVGVRRVDVVLNITAAPGSAQPRRKGMCVQFDIDCSGSMDHDGKMAAAKKGVRLGLHALSPDDIFAVSAFAEHAVPVMAPARATPANIEEAERRVQLIEAGGGRHYNTGQGTCTSRVLKFNRDTFASIAEARGMVRQVLLLTDGDNHVSDDPRMDAELKACAGSFQVHCRGVGTDWIVPKLKKVSDAMLGTIDAIGDPNNIAEEFRRTLEAAAKKSTADVILRLMIPKVSSLKHIEQLYPTRIDLTRNTRAVGVNGTTFELDLGAFGEEAQEYMMVFDTKPCEPDEEVMVCRATVVSPDPETGVAREDKSTPMTVRWTRDASKSTRIDATVAHYTGQTEKALSIEEGIEAIRQGDDGTATVKLQRALDVARQSGDDETTRRIAQLVDVSGGTVTIRRGARDNKVALQSLETGATRTVRQRTGAPSST